MFDLLSIKSISAAKFFVCQLVKVNFSLLQLAFAFLWNSKSTISFVFSPISELIALARWVNLLLD